MCCCVLWCCVVTLFATSLTRVMNAMRTIHKWHKPQLAIMLRLLKGVSKSFSRRVNPEECANRNVSQLNYNKCAIWNGFSPLHVYLNIIFFLFCFVYHLNGYGHIGICVCVCIFIYFFVRAGAQALSLDERTVWNDKQSPKTWYLSQSICFYNSTIFYNMIKSDWITNENVLMHLNDALHAHDKKLSCLIGI